jgi:CO/xanthine dehydrogenase FAD-binding subunit
MKERILDLASQMLQQPQQSLQAAEGLVDDPTAQRAGLSYGEIANSARLRYNTELTVAYTHYAASNPGAYAAQFAEVTVDTATGLVRVTDFLSANDIGQAINLGMVEGQVQGAVQMGIGYALCEEIKIGHDGQVLNTGFANYNLVNAPDMPDVKVLLIEHEGDEGPFGAKSVGEISALPTAPVVVNAVNQALGVSLSDLPLTPEKVLAAAVAGGEATLLAGGTDLLVRIKRRMLAPKMVVDLSGLEELREITEDGDTVVLGTLATHAQLIDNELATRCLPLLVQGCATGSSQIRNRGTLGGNIMNASPAADSIPPLVALGARVVLRSLAGCRELPLESFSTGPGKSQLRPDEILTAVVAPKMQAGEKCRYRKLGQRTSLAISIASVAVKFDFDRRTRTCRQPSVAFGAVAPVVRRISALEGLLAATTLDEVGIREIAARAREFCSPISDIRASAEYRREMCASLLFEVLDELTQV